MAEACHDDARVQHPQAPTPISPPRHHNGSVPALLFDPAQRSCLAPRSRILVSLSKCSVGGMDAYYVINCSLYCYPRYSVFKSRYQQKWKFCLPFRPQSEFAECNQCFDIKQEIKAEKARKSACPVFSGTRSLIAEDPPNMPGYLQKIRPHTRLQRPFAGGWFRS